MRVRRIACSIAAAAVFASVLPAAAGAQSYPNKPVRVIVAFAAGGGTDLLGRTVAQKLREALGQPFVVENRGGAGGNIGTDIVAKAPADGYTLLFGYSSNFSISPFLYKSLPYKPLRDFMPVSMVTVATNIVAAHPSLQANSLKQLQTLAKSSEKPIYFGSAGVGTLGHLTMELFKSVAAINLVHVPYNGNSAALTDLLAGRVQLFAGSPAAVVPYIRSGKLKVLGITSHERLPDMPDMPTFNEQGFPVEAQAWFGLLAPAGTPANVVKTLNKVVVDSMKSPEVKANFAKLGYDVKTSTPEEFADLIKADYALWKGVVAKTAIKPQ